MEDNIASLRNADDFFIQRDNFIRDYEFDEIRKKLEEQIQKWKNRKTKIVGDHEAEVAARDYQENLAKYVALFLNSMETVYLKIGQSIAEEFASVYCKAGIDVSYIPKNRILAECKKMMVPDIEKELLKLKEITYEEARNDFFGLFKKQQEGPSEPVRVATCYLEAWREKVMEIVQPLIDELIDWCHEELMGYYNDLADDYHEHLTELILEKTEQKDKVSAQLSDDEKKLQDDNDWLAEVKNQLQNIERG